MLDTLDKRADVIAEKGRQIPYVATAVGNMQVTYKDSYNRGPLDAIASTAIRDVMADAVARGTAIAEAAHEQQRAAGAIEAENIRAAICAEAAALSVALGVYARSLRAGGDA